MMGQVYRNGWLFLVAVGVSSLAVSRADAADPVIHAAWNDSPAPILGSDYIVSTSSPASVDFPNVQLVTGNLTWRIWSTDTDNPNSIGDIGIISSPHPQNFAVKIEGNSSTPGARIVKGIVLDPQGSGSDSNYSDSSRN